MLRIAVIGSGFGLYGLLPAFHSLKEYKVVGFCGKKNKRSLDYCRSIGLNTIYEDWKQMIDDVKPQVIAIAVIPDKQHVIATYAIQRGIHLFAEKPLSNNLINANKIRSAANRKKIKTAIDYIFPEIETWKKCHQLLSRKKYGELLNVSVNWNFTSYDIRNKIKGWKTHPAKGGGALLFYSAHTVYYLTWFLGEYKVSSATSTFSKESLNGGETGISFLARRNNINISVNVNCHAKGLNEHVITFYCEKATLRLHNTSSVTSDFTLTIYESAKPPKEIKLKSSASSGEDERITQVSKIAKRFAKSIVQGNEMTPDFNDGWIAQQQLDTIKKLTKKK